DPAVASNSWFSVAGTALALRSSHDGQADPLLPVGDQRDAGRDARGGHRLALFAATARVAAAGRGGGAGGRRRDDGDARGRAALARRRTVAVPRPSDSRRP